MILSLDTNVLIDLANGRRPWVRRQFDAALEAGHGLVTCSLAAHELVFGASISRRPTAQLQVANDLFRIVSVEDFTHDDAVAAAKLRIALRDAGRSIGPFDVLIAGQALSRDWTMVTGNVREFRRARGLRVIDWASDTETD